jgi:uncharacterized protein (TIGR02246 family)
MKRNLLAICTLGLLALVTSCAQAPQSPDTHEADIQALKDNEAQWNKDFQAKDAEKLAAHYADDAVLISPGSQPSIGKEAIHSALKDMVGDNALSLSFQAARVDVAKSGDFAFTQGSYTLTMTDPATKKPVNDKGSYVTVYKKQADGSWKAVSDIASSATPPGPALPAKK